jgi:hypothetical protein
MTTIAPARTREEWLENAVVALKPLFDEIDVELPKVRVSVGWPSQGGLKSKGRVIGQCWKTTVATDGVAQMFLSPMLDEPLLLLATLVHELIHAVDDCESGHRGAFAKMARGIGLEGKMTATVAGKELEEKLVGIFMEQLGPFPHAAINFEELEKERAKTKQSTRMIKLECPADGYIVRTTAKWLDSLGAPQCPCGEEMEPA